MAITAAMVKELREMTGAGMMDCKKALTNTDGDMDAAVEFLRENGLAKAAKKAGRIAAEGLVAVAVSEDAKEAAIVEVNSETDFVAKNDTFRTYVAEVADQALTTKAADIEGFLAEESKAEAGKTVKEALDGKIAVIGENLNIRRFAKVSAADGFVASYIHAGGKIGVLVEVATDVVNDEIKEMAKNVAMQVAAISPKYTSRDEVSKDYIEHETEILKVQAMNENPDKPENIIEKMIVGRLNKELKEVCLLDQAYVKAEDGKQAVGKYVEQVAKANGANVTIKGFVRFETGEGIEKKEEDFAAEVAAQLKENDVKIDKKMSEKIKTVSERQHLNDKTLFEILNGKISEEVKVKPKKTSIKVSKKVLNKYFKPGQKQDEIDKIIEKALEMYYQN